MVSLTCECKERNETKIDSFKVFEEIKLFFQDEIMKGHYEDVPVTMPYYIGKDINGKEYKSFADKWYICKKCGILWEFSYPDFPKNGFVRKFTNGQYQERGF